MKNPQYFDKEYELMSTLASEELEEEIKLQYVNSKDFNSKK